MHTLTNAGEKREKLPSPASATGSFFTHVSSGCTFLNQLAGLLSERVSRLLIVTALAYIFIIYFGILAIQNDYIKKVHRADRCDLSLFTLGLRTLEYLLNQRQKIGRSIQISLFCP